MKTIMTIKEFEYIIGNHSDIMMHCGSFKFTVMTCFEELMICEQQTNKEMYFKTIEDMLDGYRIGDDTLRDKISSVVLDSCS